jgi:hypothetical protein
VPAARDARPREAQARPLVRYSAEGRPGAALLLLAYGRAFKRPLFCEAIAAVEMISLKGNFKDA